MSLKYCLNSLDKRGEEILILDIGDELQEYQNLIIQETELSIHDYFGQYGTPEDLVIEILARLTGVDEEDRAWVSDAIGDCPSLKIPRESFLKMMDKLLVPLFYENDQLDQLCVSRVDLYRPLLVIRMTDKNNALLWDPRHEGSNGNE